MTTPHDDLDPLLTEPFARLWARDGAPAAQRPQLAARLAASRALEAGMSTVRRRRAARRALAPGVTEQVLYLTDPRRPLRAGEPLRARLIELQAGAQALAPEVLGDAEWLVIQGALTLDGQALALRDYLLLPAARRPALASEGGALVFLRESPARATGPHCTRDAEAGWPEFAPGIRRRVLWQSGTEAALLYQVEAGASVPDHVHGHDEECLMLAGELFLDDVLMQPGDYQVAPVGSHHLMTRAETDGVLFGHGDADLQFV